MDEKIIEKLKKKLEREKAEIEKQLQSFAKRDQKIKENWVTVYPRWNGDSGSSSLERMADELEEYENLLALEHTLEIKLRNIELALEKIKKGNYGICERCKKEIEIERLEAIPEAKFCKKCKR